MEMDAKQATEMVVNGRGMSRGQPVSSPRDGGHAPAKKNEVATRPKGTPAKKTKKVALRSSPSTSKAERLVCRYCGSDDLAPSFKKRRDARCRACFKKRYGSTAKSKRTTQTRKVKATK
jgi:hypothetical protein